MRLFVVAGFLGAGKTSLLNLLARAAARKGIKAAILENEAGKVGIDDAFLRESGFEVISMLGGCACCDLQVRLVESLNQMAARPDCELVFFEPSGVAVVDNLLDSLSRWAPAGMETNLACVVDASRFEVMLKGLGKILRSQLSLAGQVVVSKADLVDQELAARVLREVRDLAPMAQVQRADLLSEQAAALAEQMLAAIPPVPPSLLPNAGHPLAYQAERFRLSLPREGAEPGELADFLGKVLDELLRQSGGGFLGHVKLLAHDGQGRPALVSATSPEDLSWRGESQGPLLGDAELAVIAADQESRPSEAVQWALEQAGGLLLAPAKS